jgi:hypothetical protein
MRSEEPRLRVTAGVTQLRSLLHRPKFCSPSPVMVTSPFMWKILERDVKQWIINQSISDIISDIWRNVQQKRQLEGKRTYNENLEQIDRYVVYIGMGKAIVEDYRAAETKVIQRWRLVWVTTCTHFDEVSLFFVCLVVYSREKAIFPELFKMLLHSWNVVV